MGSEKKIYAFKLTPDRVEYVLEEIDALNMQVKKKLAFNYL